MVSFSALFNSNLVRLVTTSNLCFKYSFKTSRIFKTFGTLFTRANIITPNVDCSSVYLYNEFNISSGSSPFFNSITTRIPFLSDSSRKSEIPIIFFSLQDLQFFQSNLIYLIDMESL